MYAVIETGGKQYRVSEGDVIEVERLQGEAGSSASFENVLAIGGNDEPSFGAPYIEGASVSYELLGEKRTNKVIVFKMKRRKSYRRKKGHRQTVSSIKITGIKAN